MYTTASIYKSYVDLHINLVDNWITQLIFITVKFVLPVAKPWGQSDLISSAHTVT